MITPSSASGWRDSSHRSGAAEAGVIGLVVSVMTDSAVSLVPAVESE